MFARERQILLLRHEPSGVDLDVSLAWLPFEVEAIRRSEPREFAGVTVPIPRADDLVIYKLVAGRPRDHEDVERLLLLREFADALEDRRADRRPGAAAEEDRPHPLNGSVPYATPTHTRGESPC